MAHDPTGFVTEATYGRDNLAGGEFDREGTTVTLTAGRVYARGELLAKVTATGAYKLSTSAASDGSQDLTTAVILADDVDATDADTPAPVYLSGSFNERAVTFGTGHTADSTRAALRARSIYLKSTVKG